MSKGVRSICITAPTGSGKTALTAHMLKSASERGLNSWFLVHRRELVKQSISAFEKVGVNHGVISSGFDEDYSKTVQICSVQTLTNRLHLTKPPKLIVYDECHHISAGSWAKIRTSNPQAFHVGLTATPVRLDGKGLSEHFSRLLLGPSISNLIERKFLSKYRMFASQGLDTSRLHTRMGDYVKHELEDIMNKRKIIGDALTEYKKHASGKRAVAFCVSIEHSKSVVESFNSSGISAEHVDGETPKDLRDAAIERFKNGETLVLSNVELFGEGFDLPAIECAILLRPTKSLGLYLQQVGRALRPYPGKLEAIILDHANNYKLHGLPDEDREWTLDGVTRREKQTSTIQECPKCYLVQDISNEYCDECGAQLKNTKPNPRDFEQYDGDLVEINPDMLKKKKQQEQLSASSLSDLIALGVRRGYKRPAIWAKFVFNARQRKKIGRTS